MRRFHFSASSCLRACAVLLTLLCARAHAQATPASVTVVGTFQSELGCVGGEAGDWDPACAITHLEPDPEDGVWRKIFRVPGGPQSFKVAINDSWVENYGAYGQRDGADLSFSHTEEQIDVKFFYDPETHWVTNSTLTPIAVLAGSFQSELGCPGDWQPECMITWLKDLDGDGIQEFRVPSLPAGTYELKVAHHESWDENYGENGQFHGPNIVFTVPSSDHQLHFVYNSWTHLLAIRFAPTTTALTVSSNPAGVDERVTLSARVTLDGRAEIPVGTVTFRAGGEELGTVPVGPEGLATLSARTFSWGTHELIAEYNGNYASSISTPVYLQVSLPTVTALWVTPHGTSSHGAPVTLEADVWAATDSNVVPQGSVTFYANGRNLGSVPLESRRAAMSVTDLPGGLVRLSAEYHPTGPFFSSTSEERTHTVLRTAVTVSVVSDETPTPMGLPITFRAEVRRAQGPGIPATGSVSFMATYVHDRSLLSLGSATLDERGDAALVVTGLPMGLYQVTASYMGDDAYLWADSNIYEHIVTYAGSRTTVTVSPATSVYGQSVDIQVQVRPELASFEYPPTGRVQLQSNNEGEPRLSETLELNAEGRARLEASLPVPGEYAVSADYEGGGIFGGSSSSPVVVTVLRGATRTSLGSSRNPSVRGEAVTFIALVSAAPPASGTPGGNVTFRDGTHALATVTINSQGVASYTTSALEPGEHGITAEYLGDTYFEAGTSTPLAQVVRAVETPDGGSGGTDAGSTTDAGTSGDGGAGGTDAGTGGNTDAGSSTGDAGTGGDTDAGSGGNTDAGTGGTTDAGSGGNTDAGTGGDIDAGSGGNTDAGTGGTTDAGSGDTDAGPGGGTDAGSGSGDTDAGSGDTDAGTGTGDTDAGSGDTDAGPGTGDTDAGTGTGDADAGASDGDAGTTPGNDAGTQGPDAGTGTGNTDAGTSNPPAEGEETTGCGCGAGSGGSPTLMLGLWLGLTVIRSRRRANAQARR